MSASSFHRAAIRACAVALTLLGAPLHAQDHIVAASLGGRVVELLWVPEDLNWPAGGWRLERVGADGAVKVIKDKVGPGEDGQALAKLSAEERQGIQSFARKLHSGTLTDEERQAADTIFVIAAILKPTNGLALGLRYREGLVPNGVLRYRLTALDADGNALRVAETEPLDTRQRTPLPPAPEEAAASVAREGIAISWRAPPASEVAPVAGYRLLRIDGNKATNLTPELLLKGKDVEQVTYLDRAAPHDRALSYVVTSVDLFARASAPARITLPLDQLARSVVPTGLAAAPGIQSASLKWERVNHPGVRGYALERSLFAGGPYEVVTRDGLPVTTLSYDDGNLTGAATYYYRVRVFDSGGELGAPSLPVRVVPLAPGAPPAPTGLKAEVGTTQVTLTWNEVQSTVAGYFIYRRLDSERDWKRLNGVVTPEPLYRDELEAGDHGGGTFLYRVQPIGLDNSEGAFSEPVRVALEASADLPAPQITDASGEGGVAHLVFETAEPKAATRFLLMRSDAEESPSAVVGDVIPANQREVTDSDVTAGATYWYELVAIDGEGNRSERSSRVIVTIGAPDLPVPPKPTAAFRPRPFPYVALGLRSIPPKLVAVVEVRDASGKWLEVAGPVGAPGTINLTHLPDGVDSVDYRVVFVAANGARGQPSESVTVRIAR